MILIIILCTIICQFVMNISIIMAFSDFIFLIRKEFQTELLNDLD